MALPIRNSRIKLSQGQIFWREVGQGTVIVFLHGSWHDSGQWLPVMEQLNAEYHCLAPDLLGFGESEQPNLHYSIDVEVECLAEHLEALKLRRVYLVGHSLGGWIAASYALKYLDQVQGLVLLAPEGVEAEGLRRRWWRTRLLQLPITGWGLRSLYSLRKLLMLHRVERLLQRRRQLREFSVACKLLFQRRRAEIRSEQLQDQLKWLKVPVLLLQGEQERADAKRLNHVYAQLAPDVEQQQIPHAGDDLIETQAEAVAQAIRGFVARTQQ